MWIQVRSMDGKKSIRIDGLSKLTKIEDIRPKLIEEFEAPPERQRLFYRGKQLEDGYTLFDYSVGLNDIIQMLLRPVLTDQQSNNQTPESKAENSNGDSTSEDESTSSNKENRMKNKVDKEPKAGTSQNMQDLQSLYEIGEIVDAKDNITGAWFEAVIIAIKPVAAEDETKKKSVDSKITLTNENQTNNSNSKTDSCNGQNKKTNSEEDKIKVEENGEISDSSDKGKDNIKNIGKPENVNKSGQITNGHESIDSNSSNETLQQLKVEKCNSELIYTILYDGYVDEKADLLSKDIRPRSRTTIALEDLKVGDDVMVNYNYDDPTERGYWYDVQISKIKNSRTNKELYCTLFLGANSAPLENCKVLFLDEVFRIEKQGECERLNINSENGKQSDNTPVKRQNKADCSHCQDNKKIKCKLCACHHCGGKNEPDKQILCDECDAAYHIWCLKPPMDRIPDDAEWYCPECKNDDSEVVKAGEKLKESKKKSKMASFSTNCTRDWGKGMACVGRTKECTLVPPNHFGPIPGIEVGTLWKFRVQVSEAGVHRPHVAGIHGREVEGAYSIVLSGGYEDDKDDGDEFRYTGSGGRDLSGNKRTAEQSCDQTLTRMNRALALNCHAPLNDKGAEAKDWQKGKPVRVVRNCKGRKHSKFAPEEGNRYDGIYKIVKYWPERGLSGFLVWRFLLKRDDPNPSPWSKAGKKLINELGLTIQYPAGYLEAQKTKGKEKGSPEENTSRSSRKKRKASDDSPTESPSPVKKTKVSKYIVPPSIKKLIDEDNENKKLWDECLEFIIEGNQGFLNKVEETFLCICCQEIVCRPITTKCNHNVCQDCLTRSFKAEVYTCPACRFELGKGYGTSINKKLNEILLGLYPGYAKHR